MKINKPEPRSTIRLRAFNADTGKAKSTTVYDTDEITLIKFVEKAITDTHSVDDHVQDDDVDSVS